MKYVAADFSHKLTDAMHSASATIARSNVAVVSSGAAKPLDCAALQECDNCSVGIDDGMMELLREMHPEYRSLCSLPTKFGDGEHLFHAGDKLDAVYAVRSGIFKRYFRNEVGTDTVADFACKGQLLGIEALLHGTASMSAMALVDNASVYTLPLAALAGVPDAFWSAWLMRAICEERKRERVLRDIQGSQSTAETRVAFFLLEHATGYSGRGELYAHSVRLTIPRQDIASYLNLDVDTVARAFSCLQQAGIIRIERSALTIVEPECLLMLAAPGNYGKTVVW
jgi:CRP/FNR family transcriptional regulator